MERIKELEHRYKMLQEDARSLLCDLFEKSGESELDVSDTSNCTYLEYKDDYNQTVRCRTTCVLFDGKWFSLEADILNDEESGSYDRTEISEQEESVFFTFEVFISLCKQVIEATTF